MSELSSVEQTSEKEQSTVTPFGYEIIREVLLPELLGKDTPEILYWAGKRLARKFPLSNLSEIIDFFAKASWGNLSIKEESRKQMTFELNSEFISNRLKNHTHSTFQLEAGFLAQQIEFQKNITAETFVHPIKRGSKVQYTVKWDKHDIIQNEE